MDLLLLQDRYIMDIYWAVQRRMSSAGTRLCKVIMCPGNGAGIVMDCRLKLLLKKNLVFLEKATLKNLESHHLMTSVVNLFSVT